MRAIKSDSLMVERRSVGNVMDLSQLEEENDRHLTSWLLLVITGAPQRKGTALKRGSLHDRRKELEEISERKVESHPLQSRMG